MSESELGDLDENDPDREDNEQIVEGTTKKKAKKDKRVYTQQFRHQWLEDPVFKDWLIRPRPGESSCTCKACGKSISCSK